MLESMWQYTSTMLALLLAQLSCASRSQPPPLQLEEGRPLRYAATLTLDPADDAFSGEIDIDLALDGRTRRLWLNAAELSVERASLEQGGQARDVEILEGDDQTIGLAWEGAVKGEATLRLRYSGALVTDGSHGVFRQEEGGDAYLFTQFEAEDARRAFPCFDQPSDKVPWQLTLRVPRDLGAFANTPVASEEADGDWRRVVFEETPPLPSYLVAFAVGPFEVVAAGAAGRSRTPIRILAPRGRGGDVGWAVETTGRILEGMEAYFDSAYPYRKLDVVSVPAPLGWGAMENPGLVTIAQSMTVIHEEDDTEGRRRRYASVMAHELAHQWFGDLVTPRWWDDLWLNESFASWMGDKITEQLWPDWSVDVDRAASRSSVMKQDALKSARQIHQPIERRGDIRNAFDGITYAKGQAVLEMFEAWLGPEVFQRGVRDYLAAHAWGVATADDFLAALSGAAGRDVGRIVSTFLDQPGVPLVEVALDCEGPPKLSLSQRRYLPGGEAKRERWAVPVCVRYDTGGGEATACTLLDKRRGELALSEAASCPRWVQPDDGARGYYRVRYPEGGVAALLGAGGPDLSPAERVGVLGNAAALVDAGELAPGDLLSLLPALLEGGERAVVAETVELVAGLDNHLVPEDLRGAYQRFVRETYGPLATIIVLLLWFQLSALSVIVGAELDAELSDREWRSRTGLEAPDAATNSFAACTSPVSWGSARRRGSPRMTGCCGPGSSAWWGGRGAIRRCWRRRTRWRGGGWRPGRGSPPRWPRWCSRWRRGRATPR